MNRYIVKIFVLLLTLSLGLCSCVRENFPQGSGLSEGEGWLYIDFNASDNDIVLTKFTLDHFYENAVRNIYVFVFDSNGNKIYGNWLTDSSEDLVADKTAAASKTTDCWWVKNSTDGTTRGGVKIKASAGSDFEIHILANLNADMVRLSSDLLDHNVKTKDDLLNFKVYMNVESVNRNNTIVMTGSVDGVTITENATNDLTAKTVSLERLDSKIKFIVRTGSRVDANGQTIKSFTPKQWRVINVPATSYAVEKSLDAAYVDPETEANVDNYEMIAPNFFDSPWANFEEIPSATEASFSFYMLENRQTPKDTPGSYQDRSREVKTSEGLNDFVSVEYTNYVGKSVSKDIKKFQYANDFSTYVLITGRVEMDLVNDDAGQTLGADVQYLIHLGNWTANIDNTGSDNGSGGKDYNDEYGNIANFNTERNTFYTYTVTINSVNNIRVEVESSKDAIPGDLENQPGATGEVVIAKETIALCDAHYVSETMSFHIDNLTKELGDGTLVSTADELTWRVLTPFNPKGASPIIEGGVDIATGIDYKWVRFRLNKMKDGVYFSDQRRKYNPDTFEEKATTQENTEKDGTPGLAGKHNDGSMDVIYLVKWIKEQVALYVHCHNNGLENTSMFDEGTSDESPKISVTAFVDEFYYDKNPTNDKVYPELWKEFVNQPDRYMHILCDSNESTDGESRSTGSVITIQQKSIKCIYNTDPDYTALTTAWGIESVDEFPDQVKTYNLTAGDTSISELNNDEFNGRANSACEWGLVNVNANQATDITLADDADGRKWGTYLNYEVPNSTPQMQDDYKSLRYFCMARNRDNNGDGKITKDEIRWYLASKRQLIGLFVGQGLVDASSKLYYRNAEQQKSTTNTEWRQHVISSTRQGTQPCVIWGEEGISTGPLSFSNTYAGGLNEFSIRCARNLGVDHNADFNEVPDDYIQYDPTSGVFESTHLNSAALRDPNSGELLYQDQNSPQNRLYKRFEVAPENSSFTAANTHVINTNVTEQGSAYKAGYCPEGYRLPNQIELAVMISYMGNIGNLATRTYWSFGVETKKYPVGSGGFIIDGNRYTDKQGGYRIAYYSDGNTISLGGDGGASTVGAARCIRDIRVE